MGEPTTDLAVWALERQGFYVTLLKSNTSLWQKLYDISELADDDYLRVDADTIVNRNVLELIKQTDLWWYQTRVFDWWRQDLGHGGVQFIRQPALEAIRAHINEPARLHRPESYLFRLAEFHEPRRCGSFELVCGLHGFAQADMARVKQVKTERGQSDNYDFELAEGLNAYIKLPDSN